MKKYLLLTVITTLTFYATAQEYQYVPFPDSNAVWSEIFLQPMDDPGWKYNKYALFNEDTVINGVTYHKLFHTHASEITRENSEYFAGLRKDSTKKVFIKYADSYSNEPYYQKEFMIYDFGVDIGDTLWSSQIKIFVLDYIIVRKIDTIQVNNSLRKRISFGDTGMAYWIEGIGSAKGLFFPFGDLPTSGMNNYLICMHHNDTLMYYYSGQIDEYDDCVPQFVKDGVALLPNTEVKVYPNPVNGGIVNFEGLDFEALELFDLNGSLIQEEKIRGEKCYQLDISNLPPGVYTYRLKTNGLVPIMGKIIVP